MIFIKITLTEEMLEDYKECSEMADNAEDKVCEECSMYGGARYGCLGEYPRYKECE
ncbi:MAG: hypothetical protein NC548_39670 [Lachnospiraceae bacterium]|nr:hypothetical protein [Lachnospiraceae bacterium]